MKELFFAELRRFRLAALIFGAAHLVLQLLVGRIQNVLEMPVIPHVFGMVLFMLCGLALGLYQFGVYRQPGRWIWLLHRPMPRVRIFGAVGGASVLLIVLAVGLPALVALLCTEHYTARVVDLRHYALTAHLVLLTVMGWLAGATIILSRTRMAFTVLALPVVMLNYLASGFVMLVPALACIAILAVVAYASFKPDRQSPSASWGMTVATAVPLQIGLYCALGLGATMLYVAAQTAAGLNPPNHPALYPGGIYALAHKNSQQALDEGLALSNDPRAPQWREALRKRPSSFIMPLGRQYPVRGQASNLQKSSWLDRDGSIIWTFSHDAMRFRGRDAQTGEDRGWLGLHGIGDAQPFPAVPVTPAPGIIMAPQQFYVIPVNAKGPRQLLAFSGNETLVSPLRKIPGLLDFSLTNQRLVAHPSAEEGGSGLLPIAWSVALPGPLSNLDRVDIANLTDGTLLSFNYGRAMSRGAPGSTQTLMFVAPDGKAEVISRRVLTHDYPALFEHVDWWTSPLLHALTSLPSIVFDKGKVADLGDPWHTAELRYPRPPVVIAAALLLAVLSGLGAHRWLRCTVLPGRGKAAWIVACMLVGLPALVSLMALQPRARPLVTARQPSRYAGAVAG